MYNGIKKIESIIDYIETHITEELECDLLASKMQLSVYEFRRIFSFVVGCPISEYIRKRKLSLAATEIMTGDNVNLQEISEKYGYSSQSAFTRAFCEHHGFPPSVCLQDNTPINLFTCPKFSVNISGRETVPFTVKRLEAFFISGFSGVSPIIDSCCCEDMWNAFYESGADKKLCTDKLYVSYHNCGNNVNCSIGEKGAEGQEIPASRWACFAMNTTDDDVVNEAYSKIIYEWLPSANLKRNENMPTVEIYPFDMSKEGFTWEILIPLSN